MSLRLLLKVCLVILALGLTGCGPQVVTPPPTSTPPPTLRPTRTARPTDTATPFLTSTPIVLRGKLYLSKDEPGEPTVIYTTTFDLTPMVKVATLPASDVYPEISPDGERLIFSRFMYDQGEQVPQLYVMELGDNAGSASRLVPDSISQSDAAWSPDGQEIAYIDNNDLFVVSLATGEVTQITDDELTQGCPSWSPSGNQIAYVVVDNTQSDYQTASIFITTLDASQTSELLPDHLPQKPDPCLSWSPIGNTIAFHSRPELRVGGIYLVDNDRGVVRELDTGSIGQRVVWSPDGQEIAYFSRIGYEDNNAIRIVHVATNMEQLVMEFTFKMRLMAWLPDSSD